MHLILAFIQRKLTDTVCLHHHFMTVRVWDFASRCDILTFHCGEYLCLETSLNVEAVDSSETSVHIYQAKRHYILLYCKLYNTLLFAVLPCLNSFQFLDEKARNRTATSFILM